MTAATTRNRLEKMTVAGDFDDWGDKNNNNFDLIDEALDGVYALTLSGSITLAVTDYTTDNDRRRVLHFTGGTGGTVQIPNREKLYHVRNDCTGEITFASDTPTASAVVPAKTSAAIFCNGSQQTYSLSSAKWRTVTAVDYSSVGGTTATFELNGMETYNELKFQFAGFGHSTVGATSLRVAITDTPGSYSNHVTIGSYAGAANVYGTVTMTGQANANTAAELVVALDNIANNMQIGSNVGAVYGARLGGLTLAGVRFDFNGATLDSGIITVLGR